MIHFSEEMYGLSMGDQQLVDKNYTIKYLIKSFPVTSQISTWLPLFAPDVAKDWGIKVPTQSRLGR